MKCQKCGRDKILVEQAVTGFPDFHVCGTRQEYCGYCDEPPVIELSVGDNAVKLCHNAAYNKSLNAELPTAANGEDTALSA